VEFLFNKNRYYPKQDLHASHFQGDTVLPDSFFMQGKHEIDESKFTECAKNLIRE
jgi:hypothetical protein